MQIQGMKSMKHHPRERLPAVILKSCNIHSCALQFLLQAACEELRSPPRGRPSAEGRI